MFYKTIFESDTQSIMIINVEYQNTRKVALK